MKLFAGDIVVDRESADREEAIVVNTPPATCEEWEIGEHDVSTVAQANPDYPPESRVVCVVYRDDLRASHPDYDGVTQLPLSDLEARFFSFPEPRLKKVGEIGELSGSVDDNEGSETRQRLIAIKERLEADGIDAAIANGVVITSTQKGMFTVHPDGTVEGESHTDLIQAAVQAALDTTPKVRADGGFTDTTSLSEHLSRVVAAIRDRGTSPAGDLIPLVGVHPDIEVVWEPKPPIDPRSMSVWVETRDELHKLEVGRYRGHAVADHIGRVCEKASDRGERIQATLNRSFRPMGVSDR